MSRWLRCVAALLLALSALPSYSADLPTLDSGHWDDRYDKHFRKYTKRYFGPGIDWNWFKAQAVAESHLKPEASNPSGARGIMQILPSTFAEIRSRNPDFVADIHAAEWNIAAGIYYDSMLFGKQILSPLSTQQRLKLVFASYNVGFGNVLRAVRKTGGVLVSWEALANYTPLETRTYVKRIAHLKGDDDTKLRSPDLKGLAGRLLESFKVEQLWAPPMQRPVN